MNWGLWGCMSVVFDAEGFSLFRGVGGEGCGLSSWGFRRGGEVRWESWAWGLNLVSILIPSFPPHIVPFPSQVPALLPPSFCAPVYIYIYICIPKTPKSLMPPFIPIPIPNPRSGIFLPKFLLFPASPSLPSNPFSEPVGPPQARIPTQNSHVIDFVFGPHTLLFLGSPPSQYFFSIHVPVSHSAPSRSRTPHSPRGGFSGQNPPQPQPEPWP